MNTCLYSNKEGRYFVTEPLVIRTLMNIFRDMKKSFVENVFLSYFALGAVQDASTFAVTFDRLMALALIEKKYSNERLFSGFDEETKNFPEWWTRRPDNLFHADSIKIDADLIDEIKTEWHLTKRIVTANLPAKTVGMDVSEYDRGVHLGSGHKTTKFFKGVGKDEIGYNSQTSNFINSYIGKKGNFLEKNSTVLTLVRNLVEKKELIGRVVMEVIIPKAEETSEWKPGIQIVQTDISSVSTTTTTSSSSSTGKVQEAILETVLIRVDASNILKTRLFSKNVCDQLSKDHMLSETYGACSCRFIDIAYCQSGNCGCQKNGKQCSSQCTCQGCCEPNPIKKVKR